MSQAASDLYEMVVENPSGPSSWFRSAITLVVGLFTMGAGPANPGGLILSVRRKDDGEELFRHIEDFGDDEGHLLEAIEQNLATMTAADFESTWL